MQVAAEQEEELRSTRSVAIESSPLLFLFPKDIQEEMLHVEVEIFKARSKVRQYIKYRDETQVAERRAIESLERELANMNENYEVLSSTFIPG